jgi:hypothetical protein
LAASSAQLGNRTAAGAHAREVVQRLLQLKPLSACCTADGEHVREGWLKAGLPD